MIIRFGLVLAILVNSCKSQEKIITEFDSIHVEQKIKSSWAFSAVLPLLNPLAGLDTNFEVIHKVGDTEIKVKAQADGTYKIFASAPEDTITQVNQKKEKSTVINKPLRDKEEQKKSRFFNLITSVWFWFALNISLLALMVWTGIRKRNR